MKEIQKATLDAMGILHEGEQSELGFDTILSGKAKVLFDGEHSGLGLRSIVLPGETIKEAVSLTELISERYARLKIELVREHLLGILQFKETEKGFNILLKNKLLFNPGRAEINPRGTLVLDKIGKIIEDIKVDIVVEGHTDNLPINTERFPSNWELSIARAVNVVNYLTEVVGVNPVIVSATGYGDRKPKASNDTPKNQSENRRVEIVLKPQIL